MIGISTLKSWALAVLGAISAVFAVLWSLGKAKHEKERREAEENAREVESNAVNSMIEGLNREEEARNEETTPGRFDHFEH